ncbi:hypothetical protein DFS34DRAFT_589013 [Phlyctochytrium arcticum]|nr:hypothetical protein DFS34DRAFT_589013 [Phlyctochytrium arcticum]
MANIIALANPSTFTALASVQQQPILPSSTLLPRTITAAPGTINSAPAPPSRATDLMPNTTSSIVGYWEEYNEGAHGNEPLKVIEEREGTKWRLSGADSKKWGRRQTFHQAILKRVEASPGITGLQVAEMLDETMTREGWGIENLRTRIRKKTFDVMNARISE